MPRSNSRIKRPGKHKIVTIEAHHTGKPRAYLEVKSSKVKVTRPTNAASGSASYLRIPGGAILVLTFVSLLVQYTMRKIQF